MHSNNRCSSVADLWTTTTHMSQSNHFKAMWRHTHARTRGAGWIKTWYNISFFAAWNAAKEVLLSLALSPLRTFGTTKKSLSYFWCNNNFQARERCTQAVVGSKSYPYQKNEEPKACFLSSTFLFFFLKLFRRKRALRPNNKDGWSKRHNSFVSKQMTVLVFFV